MKCFAFLGPPGSGKGTQAAKLQAEYGYLQISTGDLIRDEIAASSELGKIAEKLVNKGKFVSDDLILDVIAPVLTTSYGSEKGLIFDGFPRTLNQGERFDRLLKTAALSISQVFLFELHLEEIIKRIKGRLVCQNCHHVFHVSFVPPKDNQSCDFCHHSLVKRQDDTEQKVRARYALYEFETLPLIQYYKDKLVTLDAHKFPDEVYSEMRRYL